MKLQKTYVAAVAVALAVSVDVEAYAGNEDGILRTDNIEDVLMAVAVNNPQLIASGKDVEAQTMLMKSENMLEDPTVEYSSF